MFEKCKLKDYCTTKDCSLKCYPFTFLHGVDGNKGVWHTRNIPKNYENCSLNNYPDIQPKTTKATMERYMKNCLKHVENGVGMFLHSVPNSENTLGTGTGKTTTACAIVNEFLVKRTLQHMKGEHPIKSNPVLFAKMSQVQNTYNAQFRGTVESQNMRYEQFHLFKDRMKKVELLVIDDIAIRNGTEAFLNELYEVIDHRVTEGLATIYTSNLPLKGLQELLGERIVSRIVGSTYAYPFTGQDHRMKGKVI